MSIRVLIADDHQLFLQGLKQLLDGIEDVEVIAEATDGLKALEQIRSHKPDIALLDVAMPELSGVEVAAAIQKESLPTKVLLLTMFKEVALLERALATGAAGFVLKESAFEELVFALKRVSEDGVYISPTLAAKRRRLVESQALTAREVEVLDLVADGLTSLKIAKRLHISLKTVENHRANVMRKLDVSNTAQLIRKATATGLLKS